MSGCEFKFVGSGGELGYLIICGKDRLEIIKKFSGFKILSIKIYDLSEKKCPFEENCSKFGKILGRKLKKSFI